MKTNLLLFTYLLLLPFYVTCSYDFTLIAGTLIEADGWSRFPIQLIENLHPHLKLNFYNIQNFGGKFNASPEAKKILMSNSNREDFGKIVFVYNFINHTHKELGIIPKDRIRVAYTMFETSRIPKDWAQTLNLFDALAVPDQYLKDMYKASGVIAPIFVLPFGCDLEVFLAKDKKVKRNKIFTFGSLVHMQPRKNLSTLIHAFSQEFNNNPDVKLIINSRNLGITTNYPSELKKLVAKLKAKNITVTTHTYSWQEYIETMRSFDCYVNIAKGEGFSISPREALALGLPCILTNNTAQITICNTGFIKPVASNILEPVKNFYPQIYGSKSNLGYFFNCRISDVRDALRDVYEHYESYLEKAEQGREWVKEYQWSYVKQLYINFIKPKQIELTDIDEVSLTGMKTTSKTLFNKYMKLINQA